MKWKGTLRAPRLDLTAYRKKLHEHLSQQTIEAAKKWFDGAIMSHPIPVWSGASRATFRKLADQVGYSLPISPVVASRIPLGEGASQGHLTLNLQKGKYTVHYSTTLKHLVFNEYNNANAHGFHLKNPGPYNFQVKGQAAFEAYASTIRLYSPWKFLTPKVYKVS